MLDSHFQTATLVTSPNYPNCLRWSEENLIAVASGRIITILNPSSLRGARGVVKMTQSANRPIDLIEKGDIHASCLLPLSMSRDDSHPYVRSISWSPLGLAPNSGCLLAVCSTDGSVKLYRQPYCEFSSEWLEVANLTALLHHHCQTFNFWEEAMPFEKNFDMQLANGHISGDSCLIGPTKVKTLKSQCSKKRMLNLDDIHDSPMCLEIMDKPFGILKDVAFFKHSVFVEDCPVEVHRVEGSMHVWLRAAVRYIEGSRAQVIFPEVTANGESCEWVNLNMAATVVDSSVNAVTTCWNPGGSAVRPLLPSCTWPREILQSKLEKVLKIGQKIEVWLKDRWIAAQFMGLNSQGVVVELSGNQSTYTADPVAVRFAPIWRADLESWEVTLFKTQTGYCKMQDHKIKRGRRPKFYCSSVESGWTQNNRFKETSNAACKITADQCAHRLAVLHSLVVAWSPAIGILSHSCCPNGYRDACSILAVGEKSGQIFFWRIRKPKCYTVGGGVLPVDISLVGHLQAHNSWITAINWSLSAHDASNPQLLIVAGCSDGNVKIWHGDAQSFVKSTKVNDFSLSLLKEVSSSLQAPISALSLLIPKYEDKILSAIGKGSGSLEVSVICLYSHELQNIGCYDAHDQVVTGLEWAFDGHCLFSSGQDNSVRSWEISGNILKEISFSCNCCGSKSPGEMPLVFDSCFGLAMSPGNLIVAVVRSCDVDLLHPMYQARTQKAAVDFYWTGGLEIQSHLQQQNWPMEISSTFQQSWESNILWSLKRFENMSEPLVVWDIIAALTALSQSTPDFVETLLLKWFTSLFVDALVLEKFLLDAPMFFSKGMTRALHLVNVICRRLVLPQLKSDVLKLWIELLSYSEEQLQERMVACNLLAALHYASSSISDRAWWLPSGIAQMQQWITMNHGTVSDQLKCLQSRVEDSKERISSIIDYTANEECGFCSSLVPFESPEIAFCDGARCSGIKAQRHKLHRCAVSMQVLLPVQQWFCMCCGRLASKLTPAAFFLMTSPFEFTHKDHIFEEFPKAVCPYCGVLLQRYLPDFLLSPSPV